MAKKAQSNNFASLLSDSPSQLSATTPAQASAPKKI